MDRALMHVDRHKLIEASIAAGSAFFGVLLGITVAGILPEGLWAAGVAAGAAFFASLGGNGIGRRTSSNQGG